ncbi:MAG: hypothetical protein VX589_16550 [Myxococcota bacterium]|nr:hypothetical protein [Myxococcota bacterium]
MRLITTFWFALTLGCSPAPPETTLSRVTDRATDEKVKDAGHVAQAPTEAANIDASKPAPVHRPTAMPGSSTPTQSAIRDDSVLQAIIEAGQKIQRQGEVDTRGILGVQSTKPDLDARWTSTLEEIAGEAMMKRWRYDELVEAKAWQPLMVDMKNSVERAGQDPARRLTRFIDALRVGVKHAQSDRVFERVAGYAVLANLLGQNALVPESTFRRPYLNSLSTAYVPEREVEEKRQLLAHWRTLAEPVHRDFLLMVASLDDDWQVREKALNALTECTVRNRRCGANKASLTALHRSRTDSRTRHALYRYAAASRQVVVTEWCAKLLDTRTSSVTCREALSLLGTPQGFEILYAWLAKRMYAPETQLPDSLDFRDEFKALLPYANVPYAAPQYLRLLRRVLLQNTRSGYATGAIVKTMTGLTARKEARDILAEVETHYRTRLGPSPSVAADKYLMKTIEATKRALARAQ